MPTKKLDLDLDDDDAQLTVNREYAKSYEDWRKKEELQKFKDKYGTDNLDELDEDYDSDDSVSSVEAVDWTADDERDFLRTLGALKTKNPKIYKNDVNFFNEERERDAKPKPTKAKSKKDNHMSLRDYEQKLVVERGGQLSEDEDDDQTRNNDPSYAEEQARLKQELKDALNSFSANESGDEEDTLLKKRVKTAKEKQAEEDEYLEWLKGHRQEVSYLDEDLQNLKKKWQEPELDDNERFLRDYILNKQYDTDGMALEDGELPTYEEILQQDEEEDKRNQFEVKYNFRFEEPDQEFIKQYPRTVKESLRKQESKRKEARERRKLRKEQEKRERQEEIREMKAIQKAEKEKKLKELRKMAGDEDLPFDIDDLEKDFDPEEHDRKMAALKKRLDEEEEDSEPDSESPQNDEEDGESSEEEESKPTTSASKNAPTTASASNTTTKPELAFRYRPVEPNSFGLSTDEILKLEDRQLNAWVSMKKVTGYRDTREEVVDKQIYERKAQNPVRKQKILSSVTPKLPKPKKSEAQQPAQKPASSEPLNSASGKKKRHRKRKSNMDLDAQRLRAYGVNTRQLKSTLFKKKKKMSN